MIFSLYQSSLPFELRYFGHFVHLNQNSYIHDSYNFNKWFSKKAMSIISWGDLANIHSSCFPLTGQRQTEKDGHAPANQHLPSSGDRQNAEGHHPGPYHSVRPQAGYWRHHHHEREPPRRPGQHVRRPRAHQLEENLLGVCHARFLVHRPAGSKPAVLHLVVWGPPHIVLDDWLL